MNALPSNRDEHWKYAALRALASARLEAFDATRGAEVVDAATLAAALPPRIEGYRRIVLVDGLHSPALSDALPQGMRVQSTASVATSFERSFDDLVDRRFAALNAREAREELRIDIGRSGELDLELLFVCASAATAGTSHPRVRITVGDGARLSLLERQLSATTEATVGNLVGGLQLGRDAQARIVRTQFLGARAQWLETLDYLLEANARCELVHVAQGAAASRTTAFVEHVGRGAQLTWSTAALGDGSQVHDQYVRVNHAAPDANTVQHYRGIAAGRARLAFNGHMQVAAGTSGCSSDQSLRCLLAGTEAEADVRPQLEIHTDAVRATHGATVGKLDADMKFYLASRGIEPEIADALLKWAFVSDVLAHVEPVALRRDIEARLALRLPDAGARA